MGATFTFIYFITSFKTKMTNSEDLSHKSQIEVYSIEQDGISNACHAEDTTGGDEKHNVIDRSSSQVTIEAWTEECRNETDGRDIPLG